MENIDYKDKYLKYKLKYLELKESNMKLECQVSFKVKLIG